MKVAKSVLNKIVNEEYSRAVSRRKRATQSLTEGAGKPGFAHHLATVEADDLVEFANRWAKSGKFIQENVQQMLTGEFGDLDPAAIQEARGLLEGFHPDLDEAFSEYEKHVSWDD
jgi:hypothetical protein